VEYCSISAEEGGIIYGHENFIREKEILNTNPLRGGFMAGLGGRWAGCIPIDHIFVIEVNGFKRVFAVFFSAVL